MGEGEDGDAVQRPASQRPFFNLFTPRPEEVSACWRLAVCAAAAVATETLPPAQANFNEFGQGSENVRDSIVSLFNPGGPVLSRHSGDGARDAYQELPADRDDEYDPYAPAGGDEKVYLAEPSMGQLLSSLPERREDFITVDWAFYAEKDRERRRKLERKILKLPLYQQAFLHAWDGAQAWIALLLIAFLTGAIAAVIGIGCEWFTDLRFGVCTGRGFWITREICCKDVHASEVSLQPQPRRRVCAASRMPNAWLWGMWHACCRH